MNQDPHLVKSYRKFFIGILLAVLFLHLGAYQNQEFLPFFALPALSYLLGGCIAHRWFPSLNNNLFLLAVALFICIVAFPILLLFYYDFVIGIWNAISVDVFMLFLGAAVASYYENLLRTAQANGGSVNALGNSPAPDERYGELIYRNGSAENSRKYNRGNANDGEQTFCLYKRGLLELPSGMFTPVEAIESIIVDGGSGLSGLFGLLGNGGPSRNIWFVVQQEQRHYSLVSDTEGWAGELGRVLIGGNINITRDLVQMGFGQKIEGVMSGKTMFTKIDA